MIFPQNQQPKKIFPRPGQWIFLTALVMFFAACAGRPAIKTDAYGTDIYARLKASKLPWEKLGKSVEGREIYGLTLGDGDSTVIIFGGFHGSEREGADLVLHFAEMLYPQRHSLKSRVVIVPAVNPDGLVRGERLNANRVDVNRNFPTENWGGKVRSRNNFPGTSPASEPETRMVIELLKRFPPQRIVSVHTALAVNNYDGPGAGLAGRMAEKNGYPAEGDIGYPTPGSFGTYAGKERGIPTITLELGRRSFQEMRDPNLDALMLAVTFP